MLSSTAAGILSEMLVYRDVEGCKMGKWRLAPVSGAETRAILRLATSGLRTLLSSALASYVGLGASMAGRTRSARLFSRVLAAPPESASAQAKIRRAVETRSKRVAKALQLCDGAPQR